MKMRFSRRPSVVSPRTFIVSSIVVAVVLLVLLLRFIFPSIFSNFTSGLWGIGSSVSGVGAMFAEKAELLRERDALQVERDALLLENTSLREAVEEYRELTEDGEIAQVLARPPLTPYDVLIVDRGSDHGIAVGDRVFAEGGVPVGLVADVSTHEARVTLFSSGGYETYGWVGEDKNAVTFVGQSMGAFYVTVPRDVEIVVGDTAYMPGPGARPFGQVVNVRSSASSPEQVLHVRPYISPFSLTTVEIVHGEI